MTAPQFTAADVGCHYQDANGDVWKLVAYSDQPTASIERVSHHRQERRDGAVGAPVFEGFRKLVPEDPR